MPNDSATTVVVTTRQAGRTGRLLRILCVLLAVPGAFSHSATGHSVAAVAVIVWLGSKLFAYVQGHR